MADSVHCRCSVERVDKGVPGLLYVRCKLAIKVQARLKRDQRILLQFH